MPGKTRLIRCTVRPAFTLLELLAVLTLAVLLLVLAAGPMAGRLNAVALRKSCGLVTAAARQGRLLAMEGRQACRLILDIDAQTVQLAQISARKPEDADLANINTSDENMNPYLQLHRLDEDVRLRCVCLGDKLFHRGRVDIDFDRLGESQPVQIELATDKDVRTILLAPYGGKMVVFAGSLADWKATQRSMDASAGEGYE